MIIIMHLAMGDLPIVAEDLGEMFPSVRQLLKESGFPGMKVLHSGAGRPLCQGAGLPLRQDQDHAVPPCGLTGCATVKDVKPT